MFARLSKFVRWQLAVFLVLTLIGTGYTTVAYMRVPEMLGLATYPVVVRLPDGGGLYSHASVNYRGVPVGQVDQVRLADQGVEVDLSLRNDIAIPADVVAEAHSTSAAGEQYVELTPLRDGGGSLRAGSVIDHARNNVPVPTGELISNLDGLVSSVPHDSLRTVIDEAYAGFNGSGTDLARLLDATGPVLGDAEANLDVTRKLLDDSNTVLEGQAATSGEIRSFAQELSGFTDTVRASDPDLRTLLKEAPPVAQQGTGLLQDIRPTLPILLANMTVAGGITTTYLPSIEQTLVLYPAVVAGMQSTLLPHADTGQMLLNFALQLNDPPPCQSGYPSRHDQRSPSDTTSIAPGGYNYCDVPADDIRGARGARNLPCMEVPGRRAGSAQECRGEPRPSDPIPQPPNPDGTPPGGVPPDRDPPDGLIPNAAAPPHVAAAPYDPTTGRFSTPDGHFFVLGGVGQPNPAQEDKSWRRLLLGPVGL